MLSVAKKKDDSRGAGRPPLGGRKANYVVGTKIDDEVGAALDRYMGSLPYTPTLRQVLERALRELLEREGHWPSPEDGD